MCPACSILLVDDHALYRDGVCELFKRWDDFEVAGQADNGARAVEFCRSRHPDIVLMDVQMPVMNGIEATRAILKDDPDIRIVMLSLYADQERVSAALSAGAKGYLTKSIYARQLHGRLQAVMKGEGALSDEVAMVCIERLRHLEASTLLDDESTPAKIGMLTDHERRLLGLVARGDSNREIAQALYIGEGTVKKQLSSVMVRLGLKNRVQAAIFAVRSGLAE